MKPVHLSILLALLATFSCHAGEPLAKKEIVLPSDWSTLEIQTGAGSCWGERTSPYLAIAKTVNGGTITLHRYPDETETKPRQVNAAELKDITDRLVAYCSYFTANGRHSPNYWLLQKVLIARAGSNHPETLSESPLLDPKSEEFHIWLRSLHPEAKPLEAERKGIARLEKEKFDTPTANGKIP